MSEIRATTISDAAGTGPITLTGQSAAKVWVNHDDQQTINDSQNLSSITDNGTGDGTFNFTNNMGSEYYSIAGINNSGNASSNITIFKSGTMAAANIRVQMGNDGSSTSIMTLYDFDDGCFTIHGDLA